MQKNIDEAVKWLRKAAELGNQEAMLKLGNIIYPIEGSFAELLEKSRYDGYNEGYNDAKADKRNKYVKDELKKATRFGNVKVGSIIKFGRYKQFKSKEEELEWRVLDREGNRALIISRYILDDKLFDNRFRDVFWKDCSLRKWLNNDFFNIAFNDTEKVYILTSNVEAEYNPKCSTPCGEDTKDKIFLLGIKEAETLFPNDKARICEATYYARSNGVYIYNSEGMNARWRLRTNGIYESKIVNVTNYGDIDYHGHDVNDRGYGVRPAMWVELDEILNISSNNKCGGYGIHLLR